MAESINAARRSSGTAWIVLKLVALCALLPYCLVALAMRLMMARVFFLSGQAMIEGPTIPLWTFGRESAFSVILPTAVTDATIQMFQRDYAALPISPVTAAYIFGYAEFVLPICLVIGFATRFAALGLLVIAALMCIYVTPGAFWSTYLYWFAILSALVSVGPGALSFDALLSYLNRR